MAAGTYQVSLGGVGNSVLIRRFNHEAVLAVPMYHKDGKVEGAKMVFECGRGTCTLSQIWPGNTESGLQFATPKLDRREVASRTVIPLRVGE